MTPYEAERPLGALKSLRQRNRNQVVALLRESGTLHRAELARRAGLSRSTVTTIVSALIAEGVVTEALPGEPTGPGADVPRAGSRGRVGELLRLASTTGAALGIDYSQDVVRAVLCDAAHNVLAEEVEQLPETSEWPFRLEAGLAAADQVFQRVGGVPDRFLGVGLGMPDPIDLVTGRVTRARSGPLWPGARAADEFAARLGVPVAVDNTSHLAALAEMTWGGGTGVRHAAYLKMSYGIGAGLFLDGRLYRGAVGAAGEIGHTSVDDDGPACHCGSRGCLELYVGTPAIVAAMRPRLGASVTIADVIAGAREGDRACLRVLEDAGARTGRAMANLCNLLNLERIVVGGDLAAAGDALLEPMRRAIERFALGVASANARVVPAKLGQRAGALGGVALVLREVDRNGASYRAEPSG
ncbi:ROK family transcriptional regulator [Streptomyces tubercidicus]|uniref:ROK family transcriptional regulator n=1 Tax=Streptomyces tubercidicus TaxID=47759 RepID=UPI0036CA8119